MNDHDLRPNIQGLPPNRRGFRAISDYLWRYQLLHMQRIALQADGGEKGWLYMFLSRMPTEDNDAIAGVVETMLGERFLQDANMLLVRQVHIQIGVADAPVPSRARLWLVQTRSYRRN